MSEIQGIGRFKFHEGNLEEFKRLSAQAIEIARTKDTGTLQYEIYFNDDQSECIVLERYRDSEALIEHGAHLGEPPGGLLRGRASCSDALTARGAMPGGLPGAPLATGSVTGACLGEPSAELRALL